jgi:dolichyl-diphosphooligosaccharide---protein glycosyltransferase
MIFFCSRITQHIALLGRALTSPEKRAHNIVKHLADYVLIWTGGGGDDLAKSPHMARIANSVFDDMCPGDPTCEQFGFYNRQMDPTPMMAKSLLYKLHQNRIRPGVKVDPNLFKEVYMTKFGKIRIYKVVGVSAASKEWTSDHKNRICDAPGSWYCSGQYPPALDKLLEKRKNFAQLEDFNKKKDEKSAKYHEEYMKKMARERD